MDPQATSNKLLMPINNSLRSSLLVVAGITLLTLSSAVAAETLRLNFGVYSSNKPSAMVRVFKPVLNELEDKMTEKLGRDVEIRMQIARDYDQGISHLTTGKVDFSRFEPASYIEAAKMNDGIEILAMENSKGEPLRALEKFPKTTKSWIARSDLNPVVLEALKTSLFEVNNESASKDAQALAAASAILSSQVMSGLTPATPAAASANVPEMSAALPTHNTTSSVLNASAQSNADSAALALASDAGTKNSFPQARAENATVQSHTLQAPAATSASSDGNQLTINIELPSQLINNHSAENNSQNITINLSFSPEDSTVTQAQQ